MGKPFCQVLKLAKCMMAHSYTSKNMELMRTTFPPLNEDGENEFSLPIHIQQIGESPDLLYSIDLITRFTFTAFDTLMAYKEGQ